MGPVSPPCSRSISFHHGAGSNRDNHPVNTVRGPHGKRRVIRRAVPFFVFLGVLEVVVNGVALVACSTQQDIWHDHTAMASSVAIGFPLCALLGAGAAVVSWRSWAINTTNFAGLHGDRQTSWPIGFALLAAVAEVAWAVWVVLVQPWAAGSLAAQRLAGCVVPLLWRSPGALAA